ncbi:MAG: response regulator [Pseudomonadota bacterium]
MELRRTGKRQVEKKQALTGNVANDFNNLLMAIKGRVSLMIKDLKPSHSHYRYMAEILKIVEKGSAITDTVLGLSQDGSLYFEQVDMNLLVSTAIAGFPELDPSIHLDIDLVRESLVVEIDQNQILRVIMGVVEKAISSMPQGGNIGIATEAAFIHNGAAAAMKMNPGRFVKITITDTGVGMDKKTLERIFDPRLSQDGIPGAKGQACTLAEACDIIRKHGGVIDVWSSLDSGTSFAIILPLQYDPDNYFTAVEDEDILMGFESVLLVDDEAVMLEVGRDILEDLGYRVMTAISGEDALDLFHAEAEAFDLVVLDLLMPGINGLETMIELLEADPDLKVVITTGYANDETVDTLMETGCRGVIAKPYNIVEFSQLLRSVLEA